MDGVTINQNLQEIIGNDDENASNAMSQGDSTLWKVVPSHQKGNGLKMLLARYAVPTNNSFQVLATQNTTEREVGESSATLSSQQKRTPSANPAKKLKSPPPIVLHSKVLHHRQFCEELGENIKKGYHIKYTKNNTNIFIQDHDEYETYLQKVSDDGIDFHTFTPKGVKNHAFVIKGLDSTVESEDVKVSLNEKLNDKLINVFKMKNTNGLFLVVTDSSVKVQSLNTIARYVCHTRVSWVRHENRSKLVQCRRCQRWGHSTTNCFATARCLKCASNHWTRDCKLVLKGDENTTQFIKCVNCNGKHLAMSTECQVYLNKLDAMDRQREEKSRRQTKSRLSNRKYEPAPIPQTNAWQKPQRGPTTIHEPTILASGARISATLTKGSNPGPPGDNQFDMLVSEFKELNSLINMNRMITLVRTLNASLKSCTTELEKFNTFTIFCQNNFGAETTSTAQNSP